MASLCRRANGTSALRSSIARERSVVGGERGPPSFACLNAVRAHASLRWRISQRQPYTLAPNGSSSRFYPVDPTYAEDEREELWSMAGHAVTNGLHTITNAVVQRMTEFVCHFTPQETPVSRVENSVKGGLALVALALLKSVLSFLLILGCVLLATYIVTQVYGWPLAMKRQAGAMQPPHSGEQPGTHPGMPHVVYSQPYPPPNGQAATAPTQPGYIPYHAPLRRGPQKRPQSDVVDVWYGSG